MSYCSYQLGFRLNTFRRNPFNSKKNLITFYKSSALKTPPNTYYIRNIRFGKTKQHLYNDLLRPQAGKS